MPRPCPCERRSRLSHPYSRRDPRYLRVHGASSGEFWADLKTQYAVIRGLEIIGEATKHLGPSTRETYPSIPWRRMAGMRDQLIHDYLGVNLHLVWEVVERDLPVLGAQIDAILRDVDQKLS